MLSRLPSLLIPTAAILVIILCAITSHEQAGTRHPASRRGNLLDPLSGGEDLRLLTLLKPRVALPPYSLSPEWIVDHHDFTCMLPISTAAAMMQGFYEDIAALAATTLIPASHYYQLRVGQIMLEITAPPRMVVEWILVQQFALDMLRMTKRGYTNTYQINFIHRPTGSMMTFSLYTGLLRAVMGGGA